MPSVTFNTPGWHSWDVPSKVKNVTVTVDGAGSGSRPGGRVGGHLAVSDTWKLYCLVGQSGRANSGITGGGTATGGGGGGGTGRMNQAGGDGGGGASAIRINSTTGSLKAVAGGAGGDSGDGGHGGAGGGTTGGSGTRGTQGTNATGQSTGGTQSQGGNGGTSSSGTQFNGKNASDAVLATGGTGGSPGNNNKGVGGGGGGGGYHAGGGGQASSYGFAPGGGGGGGSNYTGGLTGATTTQGGGGTGNGSVTITWVDPANPNRPPTAPSAVKVNNVDATSGMLTKATSSVKVKATVNDPDNGEKVRLVVRWSTSSSLANYKEVSSGLVDRGKTAEVTLSGLAQNTHYYARLYARDEHGMWSVTYNSIDFWTNKAPTQPTDLSINTQGEGMTLDTLSSATFKWVHNDEDTADYQSAFELQYRVAATSFAPAGAWVSLTKTVGQNLPPKVPGPPSSATNQWVFDPATFKGNRFYEWRVKTRDLQGLWGATSDLFSFRVSSATSPPQLLTPTNKNAVDATKERTFTWRFIDPDVGNTQVKADLRYRVVGDSKAVTAAGGPVQNDGADNWVTMLGAMAPGLPGGSHSWVVPADTFVSGYTYEWQVRTYDVVGGPSSDWSDSFFFYAISTPGSEGGPLPVAPGQRYAGALGCGTYRAFIYQQGGQRRLGEIKPIDHLTFARLRDDISGASVFTSGYSIDCGQLYQGSRTWMHELVLFRDGVRVWEGPLTRIAYSVDGVEFEAKDVMAYCYRRILRVGYNDAYRLIQKGTGGQPDVFLGLETVVRRAASIITQGLAPWDPNVLPYLTALEYPDDARESRVIEDFSRTVFEDVDDMAAVAGLDYTTVGRRILLWDTHRAIGRLPEFRDSDFSDFPIVTEYGMQLANFMAVTNGSGVYGTAQVPAKTVPYGPIEMLASSYASSAAAASDTQTPESLAKQIATLTEQAQRNIANRWPAPLIVRVPDNTTLSPKANVGFQQLIPGVWLPLRSTATPRPVTQWQKLDSVSVEYDKNGEKVHVVMSPAPNGGNDPDSDQTAEAE